MRSKNSVRFGLRRNAVMQSVVGGIVASVGLELFLHPHDMIAGGMTGISALVSFHTEGHFGVLLLLFNLPLLLVYAFMGKTSALRRVLPGLLAFSGSALLLAPLPAVSGEPIVAALAGGFCLGIGAGLAVKSGGLLDSLGLEKGDRIRPRIFGSSASFGPKRLFVLCHGAVLVLAGAMMGWERTLYSALACIAAYETSALMLWGFRKTAWVMASKPDRLRHEVCRRINMDGEVLSEERYGDENRRFVLKYSVHVLDIPRFKAAIRHSDPKAEILWINRAVREVRR